jgi:hypothetical protein
MLNNENNDQGVSFNEMDVSQLLNYNDDDIKSYFEEFEKIFQKTKKILEQTKVNLESIETNYKKFKNVCNPDKKYLIANLGFPNTHKSSAFNFLMTGTYQYPLPNSLESKYVFSIFHFLISK